MSLNKDPPLIRKDSKAGNPKLKFVELTGSFTGILLLKEPIGGYRDESN